MYFSKVAPRKGAERNPAFWRALGDGYQAHKLVWNLFSDGPDRQRDFLFRQMRSEQGPFFFTVSRRPPEDANGLWNILIKDYTPRLAVGEELFFNLLANPIISRRDDQGRQSRHDVIMEARYKLKNGEETDREPPPVSELVQRHGFAWLSARAEKNGFAVDPDKVRLDGYRQHRFQRSKGGRPISISSVEINGRLTVTDPVRLLEALYNGLGPAKSFGCGLMMVRRI